MINEAVTGDWVGSRRLSVAIVDANPERRAMVSKTFEERRDCAVHSYPSCGADRESLRTMMKRGFDVVLINADDNPWDAIQSIEAICAVSEATVMLYSTQTESGVILRAMQAGAREFLTYPFDPGTLEEALVRVRARVKPGAGPGEKKIGSLFVLLGSKGGAGVTTLASNFSVCLAQESKGSKVALLDLDLPLGDAALVLGMNSKFSTADALRESSRLDPTLLAGLLTKHDSGVSVLPAPGRFPEIELVPDAIDRLLEVACEEFDYVVVDAGSRLDWTRTTMFRQATKIYLVTQVGISELRNSNRLISEYFSKYSSKLEIVLNRYSPKALGIDDNAIQTALTRPAQWRIPSDWVTVQRMQSVATPVIMEDSPISRVIRNMARTACGLPLAQEKKTLFRMLRESASSSGKRPVASAPAVVEAPEGEFAFGFKGAEQVARSA
jgi:pilus assembly protein CpaE